MNGNGSPQNEVYADASVDEIDEIVELLGDNIDGEKAFDYLSYVFLGWRTTGGHWQNQVVTEFIPDQLDAAGYDWAGEGETEDNNAPGTTDKSAATDNPSDPGDYAWTTDYVSSSLVWDPEYAKLEILSAPSGSNALVERIETESYAFDPTSDTYIDHYNGEYGISDIDDMWDWITTKSGGDRTNVDNGKEAELGKRANLAWQTSFTAPKGTDPDDAPGVTGEAIYVGTVSGTSGNRTCSEVSDLSTLEGKVLLSDSSLSVTAQFADQVGAVAVMSSASLSEYNLPEDNGEIKAPFNKSTRYASGAGSTRSKGYMDEGEPIVEWQFSKDQYDAMKTLLSQADGEDPVIVNSVSIGDIYPMDDASHDGKGQAVTIAEVKGATKPDERILICAHSQEPGANDNATGVGALLELATRYKQMIDNSDIPRPARTITFLWGDEMSMATLWMSSHPEQKSKLVASLDMDMVGEDPEKTGGVMRIEKTPDPSATYNYTLDTLPWQDSDGLYYDPDTFADPDGNFTRLPDSHTLWGAGSTNGLFKSGYYLNDLYMAAAQSVISNVDPTFQVDVCPYEGGSDHSRFLQQNIPALLTWHFTDYTYHSSVDTLAMSSAKEMENVNITTLATAYMMADTTKDNEALATEILDKVYDAAIARIANEKNNSKNHYTYIKATGADYEEELANEKAALSDWKQWYVEAIESVKTYLIMDEPSTQYATLEQGYVSALEQAANDAIVYADILLKPFGTSQTQVENPEFYATKKDDHLVTVTISGITAANDAAAQDLAESLQLYLTRDEADSPFITVADPNVDDEKISKLFEGSIYTGDLLTNWKKWSTGDTEPAALFTDYKVTGTAIDDAGVVVKFGFNNDYFFSTGATNTGNRNVCSSFIGDYSLDVVSGGAFAVENILATDTMKFNHYESYTSFPEMFGKLTSLQEKAKAKGYEFTIDTIGVSEGGLPQYAVVFGKKGKSQKWLSLTDYAEENPDEVLENIAGGGSFLDNLALPIYLNNVHPDECPGSDVMLNILETLIENDTVATSFIDGYASGSDPGGYVTEPLQELGYNNYGRAGSQGSIDASTYYSHENDQISVSALLDDVFFIMTPNENPDGRTSNGRRNYNGFDLNRDGSFQTQSETQTLEPFIAKWNPIIMDEFHGFVANFLIEPCTPPHEQNLEYDLLVENFYKGAETFGNYAISSVQDEYGKAKEAENGYSFSKYTIPLRDYFSANGGWSAWDDLSTSYGPSYAMINCGTLGYTIEIPYNNEGSTELLLYGTLGHARYMMENKKDLLENQVEFFKRGVDNIDVTTKPIAFNDIEKWYVDDDDEMFEDDLWRPKFTDEDENGKYFPEFYVIPVDSQAQRDPADVEAFTEYLLRNDVKVKRLKNDATIDGTAYKAGTLIVDMHQGKRNYANAVMWKGIDASFYSGLYSESVVNFPQQRGFTVIPVAKEGMLPSGLENVKTAVDVKSTLSGNTSDYTYVVVSNNGQEAVRAVNALLADGKEVGFITTGANEGNFAVSKAVWGEASVKYALVGKGVKKAGGDVYKLNEPTLYIPGNREDYFGSYNSNPYFANWFEDGYGSRRNLFTQNSPPFEARIFDRMTYEEQLGFKVTTVGNEATVVVGSMDFYLNAANKLLEEETAALSKVLAGTPYIATGATPLGGTSALKTQVLKGISWETATTGSSESLHHVIFEADSPITAAKKAAGDDVVYNYGGGRVLTPPEGATILYKSGSIKDGFHIAGCFPNVNDDNLGDKIEAFTWTGKNEDDQTVDVTVFANSLTRKSHQQDDTMLAASAIYLKSIDASAKIAAASGVEVVTPPAPPAPPTPATSFTVLFNANGGKISSGAETISVEKDAAVGALPTLAARKGYKFNGWYTAPKGGAKIDAATKITQDTTFYAQWTANKYKLTLNANGGKIGSKKKITKKVTYDSKYGKLNTPKRKGYKFKGWYTKKKGGVKVTSKKIVKITKATTLYARWTKA